MRGESRVFRSVARLLTILAALLSPALLSAPAVHAGGLYVNEFSTTAQANAGAGRTAWAPDASATLHNPALMTRLDDHAFATGFALGFGRIRFDADATSPNGSSDGGNQAGIAPIASFSYAHKVSERVRFGLSFYSISGSVLDPSNTWAGRFEVTSLSLLTLTLAPSIAVRLTDWLSVGGGPLINYGVLNWDLRAPLPAPPGAEGQVQLDDLSDWQGSGRVGLVFHPLEEFSLAVYYNSKTDFDLSGDIEVPSGVAASFDLNLPLVQFVEVGAYWQATEELALLFTFNWEDWSDADNLGVTLAGNPIGISIGFKDTYKVGVGANYQLTEDWLLQTGVMFDTSALQNKRRTTALPVDQQIRLSVGAQHDLNETIKLGMSFTYLNLGQGEVRTANVVGDYQDNDLFIFGATLAFKSLPWSGKLTSSGEWF